MRKLITEKLHHLGDTTAIVDTRQVSGGEINQAFFVKTNANKYFIKANSQVPSHFFQVEAKGLKLIEETNTIGVPYVHYVDEPENGEVGVMILDWIEGTNEINTVFNLGAHASTKK